MSKAKEAIESRVDKLNEVANLMREVRLMPIVNGGMLAPEEPAAIEVGLLVASGVACAIMGGELDDESPLSIVVNASDAACGIYIENVVLADEDERPGQEAQADEEPVASKGDDDAE